MKITNCNGGDNNYSSYDLDNGMRLEIFLVQSGESFYIGQSYFNKKDLYKTSENGGLYYRICQLNEDNEISKIESYGGSEFRIKDAPYEFLERISKHLVGVLKDREGIENAYLTLTD